MRKCLGRLPLAFVLLMALRADARELVAWASPEPLVPTCSISGPALACAGAQDLVYTSAATGSAYGWSVSGNATISGPTNQRSVSVDVGNAGSFTLVLVIVDGTGGNSCSRAIPVFAKPSCSITGSSSTCAGTTVQLSGPAGLAGYAWEVTGSGTISGSSSSQNVSVVAGASGSFTAKLTTTSAQGCTNVCTKVVTVNACTIDGPDHLCAGQTGAYEGPLAAGMSWSWTVTGNGARTTPGNGRSILVQAANGFGSITVNLTITDASGCTKSCSKTVTTSNPGCSVGGPDAVCPGSRTTFGGSFGGTAPLTTSWSIQGSGTIEGSTSGSSVVVHAGSSGSFTLTFTVTDGKGCQKVCTKSVTIGLSPQLACSISGPAVICSGSTDNFYSSPSASVFYDWSITGNGTLVGDFDDTVRVTAGAPGTATLSLVVSNDTGCNTCSKAVTVAPATTPPCTISGPPAICDGVTATFQGPSGTGLVYDWGATGSVFIVGNGSAQSVNVRSSGTAGGTLKLTVTDAGGCKSTCQIPVKVNPVPPACAITGPNLVCPASSGNTFSGPEGFASYAWTVVGDGTISGPANARTVSVTSGTDGFSLTLTATDDRGCSTTCSKNVFTRVPGVTCAISGSGTVPHDSAGNVYSAPAGAQSYAWTVTGNGAVVGPASGGSVSVTAGASGSYTVRLTMTDASGCSVSCSMPVSIETPGALTCAASVAATATVGTPLLFDGTSACGGCAGSPVYAWQFGDGAGSPEKSPSHAYAAAGTFPWTFTVSQAGQTCTRNGSLAVSVPAGSDFTHLTRAVPIVLDVTTAIAHFTTELVLTNRGTTPVTATLKYVASIGAPEGSGQVLEPIAAGSQKVISDVVAFLKGKGLAIPGGNQGGQLLVRFDGASSDDAVSATARTTTATVPPQPAGAAGLAYAGVRPSTPAGAARQALAAATALTVFGLRSNAQDRSNLAVFNPGDQPIAFKVTAFAGDASGVSRVIRELDSLPPFGWLQYSGVFDGTGINNGWVTVEPVSATGPFGAYGVVNDNVTSDGSFLLPAAGAVSGNRLVVPVLVESSAFRSELVLANRGGAVATLTLSYVESQSPSLGLGGTATVVLRAGEQLLLPEAVEELRRRGITIGPPGAGTYVGALRISVAGVALADVFAGARTAAVSPAGGQFGLFTPCLYQGQEASEAAFLDGLRADEANRSNVALLNAGTDAQGSVTLEVRTFDGEDGGSEKGAPEVRTLAPGGWYQFQNLLAGKGVRNGWVRVTRVAGAAPWVAYGVINDGGQPGERTGDGAFVPMTKSP